MLTRDFYIATLEKRASDTPADSAELIQQQYDASIKDDRAALGQYFDNAGSIQKEQGRTVDRLFPGKSKSVEKVYGGPLLKVARELFNQAWPEIEGGLMKTAEPSYREIAFRAFAEEIEKIAAPAKGQTLSQLTSRNAIRQQSAPTYQIGAAKAMPSIEQRLAKSRAAAAGGIGGRLKAVAGRLFGR